MSSYGMRGVVPNAAGAGETQLLHRQVLLNESGYMRKRADRQIGLDILIYTCKNDQRKVLAGPQNAVRRGKIEKPTYARREK